MFKNKLLSNEALFGIEVDLICSRPVDSTDSSLGSRETVEETRGMIPAEHNLSANRIKIKKKKKIVCFSHLTMKNVQISCNFT